MQLLQQYLPFTVLKRTGVNHHANIATAMLQQYLPFTVLKPYNFTIKPSFVCASLQQYLPFTVLKPLMISIPSSSLPVVATVLTVYGIETVFCNDTIFEEGTQRLQQYLPFTVLKPTLCGAYYIG